MTTVEFLSYLRSKDITLWADGDKLRYSAPSGVLTSELRAELTQKKAEILKLLPTANVNILPLRPVSRERDLPLSSAQLRLWFLDQLEPGVSTYNISETYRLTGALHVAAFEQSINEIIRRHETLRTTFTTVDDKPVQIIASSLTSPLAVINLRGFSETEQNAKVQQLVSKELRWPFNLKQGPLWRFTLLRLSEEEHIFILVIHHIISDGWSMVNFYQELSTLYAAFFDGRSSPLVELPIQYADFAIWQQEWLQGETLDKHITYWKKQLDGAPLLLELPTDYPRPAAQTHHGAQQSLLLPKMLSQSINALSQREGVSLFMTLLTAFKILLHRYTGQEDIIVGIPIANRNRVEIEGLIGFFLNNLALRTDHSGDPTFREILAQVQRVALEAYAHQDLPFEKLIVELQLDRDMSRPPLFQVFFNMLNLKGLQLELSGLTIEQLSTDNPDAKFDLTLYVSDLEDDISLRLVYNTDLFGQQRMVELLAQYNHLLEQIVEAPDRPIRSYSLVTPQARLLLPDPGTEIPEPRYDLVSHMFTSWAKRVPDRPAIVMDNQAFIYSELQNSCNALARALLGHGVKQGDVVAVTGTRSFGLIASMMAVFMSGGVLLTLDRNLPRYRQQVMLKEANAVKLLYSGARRSEDAWIWESLSTIWVYPQTGRPANLSLSTPPETSCLPELAPDDAAYIFFTSGTTGVPKGVLGNHKGLAHFLNWQRETFAVRPQDRIAQLTGLSFDVVLRDVLLPLTAGASLCLLAEGDDAGSVHILPWLEREQITILHIVPALAQSWLNRVPAGVSLQALRWVFFAGEPLKDTLVRQWRQMFPEAGEIVNLYGPTETTMAKCFYPVPADILPGVQPLGSPIPETQALVLSENNQLCGISEAGEIVLRTPFRSLGYINAAEENLQQFVKNQFRDDPYDLLYHTGDRGRYLPDGSLEILGRLDDQVKIHGIRIEPAEVEFVLSQHPEVQQTFVMAREDAFGDQTLVAYVVATIGKATTISELRRFMEHKLPEYMIPSAIMMLDGLPLTPNGKVDRRALPAPDKTRPELEAGFVAPQGPLECQLTGIWEKLLSRKPIGMQDNFFELGGHSLLAIRVASRIRDACGVELPVRKIFESPTIADLALVITQRKAEKAERKDIIHILSQLEMLSDKEAQHLISKKNQTPRKLRS